MVQPGTIASNNYGTSTWTPIPGNPISFGQIRDEFGITPNDGETAGGLGGYRVSDSIGSLSNLPLDTGVPQSGQIAFSDFYSKQLNIVVKCTGGNLAQAKLW